jgi:hypothetical protein
MKLAVCVRSTVLAAVLAGCSAVPDVPPDAEEAIGADFAPAVDFDPTEVLLDIELTDAGSMTVADVQDFLEHTPYGWASVLASHQSNGRSAAQAIVDAAATHGINPLVILTRTQLEQSLIGKKTATQTALDWAMGCGCPDNQPCNVKYKGFDKQIDCMASKFRWYLDDLAESGVTVAGWKVGQSKKTLDGFWISPKNAATASIYTYTPWRSSAQNHRKIWALYTQHVGYVPGNAPPPEPEPEPEEPQPQDPISIVVDDEAVNNGPSALFEASSSWTDTNATAGSWLGGYRYRSTGATADAAEFSVFLEQARTLRVDARWTAGSNRSATAPFVLHDAGGNLLGTVKVDQRKNGGTWVTLGTFAFTAGWNTIALSRWTTPGAVVIADAVRVTDE